MAERESRLPKNTVVVLRLGNLLPTFLNLGKSAVYIANYAGREAPQDWMRRKISGAGNFANYILNVIEWARFENENDATNYLNEISRHYASNGHHVNPSLDREFSVYVFDIADRPNTVYVGQTSKSVEERIEEHRVGRYYPFIGKEVGARRVDLEEQKPAAKIYSTANALVLEALIARRLKRAGLIVLGDGLEYPLKSLHPSPSEYGAIAWG